ncbi:lipocalin family protein [Mariniphaga sp.]|uniref:lipocalin family protein n=1 Tax=Mariniphaga sp. TaxID=1954475 RepID=UPI003569E0DE
MNLKTLVLFGFVALMGCATTGSKELVGTWEIIEFKLIGTGGDPVSNEKVLKDAGAVWEMKFAKNGKFSQDFNMRQRDMTMESEKGTWETIEDSLKIELDFDTITSLLPYIYKLDDNILELTLSNDFYNTKVVTKFRKK